MGARFGVVNKNTAMVLFLAFVTAILCTVGEAAADSNQVRQMRIDAVRELTQLKKDTSRMKARASQIADNISKQRQNATSSSANGLGALENELREVARTGDLSKMERNAGVGNHNPNDDKDTDKRPPNDDNEKRPPQGEKRPPNDNDKDKTSPKDEKRPPSGDKDRRPPNEGKDKQPPQDDQDRPLPPPDDDAKRDRN